jgi:uncharacterized protein YutE (UPF0331/DUF86 family)
MRKNEKNEMTSFINEELNNINKFLDEISDYKGNSLLYRRAKGSILHDFYNTCERIFEIIARRINGELPQTEQWHKKVLYQMTIEMKSIRPAVISKKLAAELDEYLAFRHLFRNIYGFELESDKLDKLVNKFSKTAKSFQNEIKEFLKKL